MVVVKIYERSTLYATARIWNNETGTKEYANYEAKLETLYDYEHRAKVVGFPKDPGSPWTLLYMTIQDAYRQLMELPNEQNMKFCKVVIELWPGGWQERSRVLGIMKIKSVGEDEKRLCNFDVFMQTFHQRKTYERNAQIIDYEVSESNPWILALDAIDTAIRGTKYLP